MLKYLPIFSRTFSHAWGFTVLCAQIQTKEIFESVASQRFQKFPWFV
ncbi:hypothetical protein FEV09_00855 [Pseudanabaena catenata USMAC16]|uniref:Uncharacterized protein n=1 Tax=Pseudanabaena catenata USMAC16 TaxID=1855837 RepID=A0A9X4M7I5_9CYAN|nr:hypothetical protein [Pseudanabaena catenata]MDG3493100.1 hypothetical protein [Pseudanabaena catenata USMAC16]